MIPWLLLIWLIRAISATYVISVYGDVYQDSEFFSGTYPWIIDNIGGDLTVDYYLLGSGKYSVPQMCALNELKMNTFLQAQYLKCEAQGNNSEICLCATGIEPQKYRQCVLTKGSWASLSAAKYSQLGIDVHPVIEIGYKNTIFGVEDSWYLKKICTIFGDNLPRGCVKPFECNGTDAIPERSGVVNFDCPRRYLAGLEVSVNYENQIQPDTVTTFTTAPSNIPGAVAGAYQVVDEIVDERDK